MRFILTTCLFLLFSSRVFGGTGLATLSLVENEGSFGLIDITVNAPGTPDSDTTTLTGTVDVELNIDTDMDTVMSVTALGGDIQGTQVAFSGGNLLFSYSATSSPTIGCDIFTTAPPGAVNPSTGDFDASDHPFELNEGTLTGQTRVLFTSTPLSIDFATDPFGSSNSGIGNIEISLIGSDQVSKTYGVVMIYPISTTTPLDAGGTAIDVVISGVVKTVGTITVPVLNDFELWLQDSGLGGAEFEAINQYGLPLGIQWALGLDADVSPALNMLRLSSQSETSTVYSLSLPMGGSADDLTILYTPDVNQAFSSIPTSWVSVGNPIPKGSIGTVTITLPAADQGFLIMSAEEP